jgi:hypothetical protein
MLNNLDSDFININKYPLLKFNTDMNIADFIFTHIEPNHILNRNEARKYNYKNNTNIKKFYNGLKSKNLTFKNIADLIDEN